MDKQGIKEGILYLLEESSPTGDGNGYTFLEIRDFLNLNDIVVFFEEGKENWKRLKNLLDEMEEEGLIEERHFGEVLSGRVDFSIKNPGISLIEGKKESLKEKWKLPNSE